MDGHRQDQEAAVARFQELYGLSLEPGSHSHRLLASEFRKGFLAYLKAAMDYIASLSEISFEGTAAVPQHIGAEEGSPSSITLSELVEKYLEEGQLARSWAVKTLSEKREQFALLSEIVGGEAAAASLTSANARRVKGTLLEYPKKL